MKIGELRPTTTHRQPFRRDRQRYVPAVSGNYALTLFDGTVLYVGLATNLRQRFVQHLDTPEKTQATALGRAVLFHWLETVDIHKVERGWIFMHWNQHGTRPVLNKADSPIGA